MADTSDMQKDKSDMDKTKNQGTSHDSHDQGKESSANDMEHKSTEAGKKDSQS